VRSFPCVLVVLTEHRRSSVDKRTVVENYDLVCLAIDEIVEDSGIILETDPLVVASRVSKPPVQDPASMKGIELSEQGIMNVWDLVKRKGAEQLRQLA
jgi:hypothetical protein